MYDIALFSLRISLLSLFSRLFRHESFVTHGFFLDAYFGQFHLRCDRTTHKYTLYFHSHSHVRHLSYKIQWICLHSFGEEFSTTLRVFPYASFLKYKTDPNFLSSTISSPCLPIFLRISASFDNVFENLYELRLFGSEFTFYLRRPIVQHDRQRIRDLFESRIFLDTERETTLRW